jgi:two-component system OmpR family response regulator
MRVLMVEDDFALAQFLCRGLSLDGYKVTVVADGDAALESAEELRPEMMILDLGLRRDDALEMLATMGRRYRSTSVLVLTGKPGMEETVRCLELGADDVMHKPFSFHELRARLNALARRRGRFGDRALRLGDLEMDRAERRVTQAGREVELTATEFLLLESLLRRRGEQVCSRAELLREVWDMPQAIIDGGGSTNIVEVYINYLRKKLRVGDSGQSAIRTVRGKGYVLDAAVTPAEQWRQGAPSGLAGAMAAEGWNANV